MNHKLVDILKGTNITEVVGNINVEINALSFDSRHIFQNDLFIAVKGTQSDGHKYINDTISKGAIAIV